MHKQKPTKTVFLKLSIHERTLPMLRLRVEEAVPLRNGDVDLKLIGDTLFTQDETGQLFENMFEGLLSDEADHDVMFVVMRDRISEHMTQKRRSKFSRIWEAITS